MVSYFNTNEHVLFEYFRQMGYLYTICIQSTPERTKVVKELTMSSLSINVGSGVHGLVNSLLCFSQERYLRPITYSVFQWADPTPSCHTKHRPTNPQTIKFLSHFWVFGVFWQSFKIACSSQNLWENIKEKIIIGTSVVNIAQDSSVEHATLLP